MYQASRHKHLAVQFYESRAGKTFVHLLHLGVGEGNPYLRHLTGREKAVEKLYRRAQEGDISQTFVAGLTGTCPHTRALYIDADEVLVGKLPGKPGGILALAAAKFEHYGIAVMKEFGIPSASQRKCFFFKTAERILKHQIDGFHLGKFSQFVFSHIISLIT